MACLHVLAVRAPIVARAPLGVSRRVRALQSTGVERSGVAMPPAASDPADAAMKLSTELGKGAATMRTLLAELQNDDNSTLWWMWRIAMLKPQALESPPPVLFVRIFLVERAEDAHQHEHYHQDQDDQTTVPLPDLLLVLDRLLDVDVALFNVLPCGFYLIFYLI